MLKEIYGVFVCVFIIHHKEIYGVFVRAKTPKLNVTYDPKRFLLMGALFNLVIFYSINLMLNSELTISTWTIDDSYD